MKRIRDGAPQGQPAGEAWDPDGIFARAVEIVLKDSELKDARGYCPDHVLWDHAVRHCGYVQSRHATGRVLVAAS